MTTFEGPPVAEVDGIGALTLGGFLDEVTERFADNDAVVFDDPLRHGETVRWDYAELRGQARAVGRALVGLGVAPGEAVGVVMGNRPEAVAAIFGAALAGAVAVPMSTFAPRPELASMVDQAEVTVVLTQSRLLARRPGEDLAVVAGERPRLHHVVVLGDPPEGTTNWDTFLAAGGPATALGDATLDERTRDATPDDDAIVIFSSGTTATPKGMVHRHRSPALQFWVQAGLFGRHPATRMWTSLPLFWTAGLNTAVGSTLAAGGCWVAQETFDPGPALALMSRERVTEPYALPHQTGALAEHPDWPTTDLSSLRCVFGKSAFARHPTVEGDTSWMMPVGYGLSETCAFVCAHPSDTPRDLLGQSMGRLLPGTQLRVVDPATGAVLGVGLEGELAVRGATLMRCYLGRSAEQCFDADGFLHTGDTGSIDTDGYVHYSGRRTEMIKTGGANVSPAELEVALRAYPPVKLARVVGLPDPRLDQVVVACITLKDGGEATAADIQAFLRNRVAAYKVPRQVLFFDDGEIPMTTGDTKVRDEALVALATDRLSAVAVPTSTGAP